jgi:hypothetical protein
MDGFVHGYLPDPEMDGGMNRDGCMEESSWLNQEQ